MKHVLETANPGDWAEGWSTGIYSSTSTSVPLSSSTISTSVLFLVNGRVREVEVGETDLDQSDYSRLAPVRRVERFQLVSRDDGPPRLEVGSC